MRRQSILAVASLLAVMGYSGIASASGVSVEPLPDGRLQLFVISGGKLLTMWKQTTDANSAWSSLIAFSPAPSGTVNDVAAGKLPDGRMEIFVTGSSGILTSWKNTKDPLSSWSGWSRLGSVTN